MNKIAVLIISCDNYSDLWSTCSKMFKLNWPDCPYDKFILTNHKEYDDKIFISLSVGADLDWSSSLRRALHLLGSKGYEYVFTMVEDYYFDQKIITSDFIKIADSFTSLKGNFLRMYSVINPRIVEMVNSYFGKVQNHIPYRQTCAFSLWRIDVLNSLLLDGENAWEFEKIGVRRGFEYDGFYSIPRNYFKTINLVIKGKIVPSELKKVQKYFPELILKRPAMSSTQFLRTKIISNLKLFVLNYWPNWIAWSVYFDVVNRKREL